MSFRNVLEFLALRNGARSKKQASQRKRACRLGLESFEDRCTPAALLSVSDLSVVEGNDGTLNAMVTVNVTPHGNIVTVNYATANGTALAASDYSAVTGKLTFAKNELTKSIVIPIQGDRLVESAEEFTVRLSNPKGGRIADGTGVVTIADNEPVVRVADAYLTEGNEGTTSGTFTVTLSGAYDLPVTVDYATADSSALAGTDYVAAAGSITIPAGQTSQDVAIDVIGDRIGEFDKTFMFHVSSPNSYVQIANSTAYGTIADDEPHFTVWDEYSFTGSTFTFTVYLSTAYDEAVTVDFATGDGGAYEGIDYVGTSGTLTFEPYETSKTITIEVLDTTLDPNKYLYLFLYNASPNAAIDTDWAIGWWDYGWWW
jgi:chitinase